MFAGGLVYLSRLPGFAAAASLLSLVTVRTRRVITTTPDSHPPVTPAPAVHAHADAA